MQLAWCSRSAISQCHHPQLEPGAFSLCILYFVFPLSQYHYAQLEPGAFSAVNFTCQVSVQQWEVVRIKSTAANIEMGFLAAFYVFGAVG